MQCKPTLTETQPTSPNQQQQITIDSPMQIRLINFLGLQNYLMDKFIFKRKQSTYQIKKEHGKIKLLLPRQYKPPIRYHMEVGIIEHGQHSIPFVKLIPRNCKNYYFDTIVYAHGNSSDMSDGLRFMERMALIYEAEYLIFDYSGYGQSKTVQVGQDIITKDIQIVLAWLNKPLNQIILWGFSLGSYPVLHVASRYCVKGVILQCPIASVGCFFRQDLFTQIKFKQDYFANINLISSVKGKIFMVHSHADQIIPIKHVQLLYDKYIAVNGTSKIFFIQVMKLSHNGIHKYIVSQKSNDLQRELVSFLEQLKTSEVIGQKDIDSKLASLKEKVKLAKIQENLFDEDNYQIVQGPHPHNNLGVKSKKIKSSCLCFPDQLPLKSTRQKFRST